MRRTIYINGRYLGRPVTGVERFGTNILEWIDRGIADDDDVRWEVLAPRGVEPPADLKRVRFRTVGRLKGHLWEQSELLLASRDGVLISLCNSGPILHPRHLVVIHDALVYRYPEFFSPSYRALHRTLGKALAGRARIATVSNFSRTELAEILDISAASIDVVPNAGPDRALAPDSSIFERLGLGQRRFLLFVGSPAPNKNLSRAIEAFLKLELRDVDFVLVGAAARSFAGTGSAPLPDSIVRPGRLSDGEIDALYSRAEALVFPSLYEGFGIPPLEAMNAGCAVIASDIPPLREVCGDAAVYADPRDVSAIAGAMSAVLSGRVDTSALRLAGKERTRHFSWQRSSQLVSNLAASLA
jgi:glycosyltransferase involved in cell wall biosynthesis